MNHIYWAKLSISTFDFNWSHSCVCIISLTYAFGHWRATSQGDKEMSYPFVSFITYTGLGFVKQRQLMGFPSCKYFSSFCLQHFFLFSHSVVYNSVTQWTATHQASLSLTISWSLIKLMSIESVTPSNRLILFMPSVFPSIRVFYNESALHIRWPKDLSFGLASVVPMNIQDWYPLRLTGLISLQPKGLSRVFTNTTIQNQQFFCAQPFYVSFCSSGQNK